MSEIVQRGRAVDASGPLSPTQRLGTGALAAAVVAVCILLLCLPLKLPVGPMYWDLVVYLDGAQRVLSGQIPSVDFFAPVGPLGYWLFAAGETLFPRAQPLLLVQWTFLAITLPPLLPVLAGVERQSRLRALALFVPFLVFQLAPMNVEQYSSFPGVDGYGIYNRQATELLFVLTAALVFERRQRVMLFVIAWCCIALFLSKITGFAAGGMLCAFAFLAGRVSLRTALASLAAFGLALVALDAGTGLVRAYLGDILLLVSMNEGVLLSRFLQAGSVHFGIFGSGVLLLVALVAIDRRSIASAAGALLRHPSPGRCAALFDRDAAWVAAALFTGLFFETQNTGGQAFIFLWPILLAIVVAAPRLATVPMIAVLTLTAATYLPPLVDVVHRTIRAIGGEAKTVAIPGPHLKSLGAVTQKPEIVASARNLIANYQRFPEAYQAFADARQLPSYFMYSDVEFQVAWLLATEDAVSSILAYEARTGERFQTIMSLNFVNPYPYLLDRQAPRRIAIGADPFRAVPPPDAETLATVAATDLVLYPTCPVTAANVRLREIYAPALTGHREVRLSPCWIGLLRQPAS
ncbi:hypothetical protein [Aureimonas sp. AU12]|uniref:hypothetical protein n=1 Tax=Aureimonas sp. AU12 TaxID=1638161 RepID=UPI0007823813|nr:hypothetical protein [Aureimonas sp. AU12]